MSRLLLYRRYWDRIKERNARLNPGVLAAWDAEVPPPQFIDYWPWIPATLPEKMVFAALIRRRINFYFSYYFGDIIFTTDKVERYRPDFMLPDYSVIIEVAGVYWHTRPGMWEYDSVRSTFFYAAGWKVYVLTDVEILLDVDAALEKIPEVANATIHGNFWAVGDRPFDPKAAITGRMRKYPKQFQARWKDRVRGPAGVKKSWEALTFPKRPSAPVSRVFRPQDLDSAYLQQVEEYGQTWLNYLRDLWNKYFRFTEYREAYPELWKNWEKWWNWWKRFRPDYSPWEDPWTKYGF